MKQLVKYVFLGGIGGLIYTGIELLAREYSHWTMFFLGGICFIFIGLINEVLPRTTPLWIQMIIGGSIVTILEFLVGYVVNMQLGWGVWDYSLMPYNLFGQISLWYFFMWCLLSLLAILLDDYLRFWIFKEEFPKYKFF